MTGGRSAVLLDDDGNVASLIPLKEKKLKLKFGDYFFKDLYLVPGTIELRVPFFSFKIELDKDQVNLKGNNSLAP